MIALLGRISARAMFQRPVGRCWQPQGWWQCYLVNENSPVWSFWWGSCQGWLWWPRPRSGRQRQPGPCCWQTGPALTGPPPAPPTGEPRSTGGKSGVACRWILGRENPTICTVCLMVCIC